MCEFISFVVTKDGNILANDLNSHSGIEKLHNLKPDTYREAEWVDSGLTIRVHGDEKEADFKSMVMAKFKNRIELLNYFFENPKTWSGSGGLDLSGLTSAAGLVLPKTWSGSGWLGLSGLTSAAGLVLPKTWSGSGGLDLRGLTSAERDDLSAKFAKIKNLFAKNRKEII